MRAPRLTAIRARVPIWPIAVYSGHGCLHAGTTEVRPGRVSIRFCAPVSTEGLGEEDVRRGLRRSLRCGTK